MRRVAKLGLLVGVATSLPSVPASAQTVTQPGSILSEIEKPCISGGAEGEEVVVCGRRDKPRSPYRIPEPPPRFDAGGNDLSVSRERHQLYEQGDVGIHSCTAVGPGGMTGCVFKKWKNGDEQWGGKARGRRVRPGDAPPPR
ncbi:MAG TPA: hypothetical protein VIA98_01075 [Allosphingosinicella sp.]|jgi:hypothetical protein